MANGETPSSNEVRHAAGAAERLNHSCFCVTLDRSALLRALDIEVGTVGFAAELAQTHPVLFSSVPVFIAPETMSAMTDVVEAVEVASQLPGFGDAAQSWIPAIAQIDHGPIGALMGYDFHIAPTGPRLIEVNTNAGGAFLNAALAAAQRACCGQLSMPLKATNAPSFAERVSAMFVAEW